MIKVLNNLIPLTAQNRWKQMSTDRDFRWYYKSDITYHPNAGFPDFYTMERTCGYSRSVFFEGELDTPELMPWCQQILDGMTEQTGIKVEKLIRIQVNMLCQNPSKTFTADSWNAAHTDQNYDHKVLLYYINNSDGDTFLFDQKYGEQFDAFTIKQRVTPTQGTAVLFDGNHFHASSNPINTYKRYAINFNFV